MVWVTRNQASAWHAASIDQSNALLQNQVYTKFSITVTTLFTPRYNRIHWQQSCLLLEVACLLQLQEPASSSHQLCLHCHNQPILIAPAEECTECSNHLMEPQAQEGGLNWKSTLDQPGGWGLEMLLRLDQILAHFGIVKPKKEVYTQSRNQGIFLQFWQTLSNSGPLRLKLVAVGVGPYFNFVSFTLWSVTHHSKTVPIHNWTDV